MGKVALVVTIEYTPESKAAMLKALSEHGQRCLETEPGTLQFDLLSPSDVGNTVMLYELYESAQALSAHDAGSSLERFRQEVGAFIVKATIQHCTVLAN